MVSSFSGARSATWPKKVEQLEQQGVGFRSIQEAIDTTSPTGKLVFPLFGALSEFERDLVRERTLAGLARARGRQGGRRRSMDEQKVKLASRLMRDPELSIAEVRTAVEVSSATLYRVAQRCAGSYRAPVAQERL